MEDKWLQIGLMYYPIYVLGIGKRVGIWTQGCSIRCEGCMSKHSWDFSAGKKITFKKLFEKLKAYDCKKITISGGEPFEQRYFLEFLKGLRSIGFDDVFVYSGYELDKIKSDFIEHLNYIDALVYGKFIQDKESEFLYKGSSNQELIILNQNLHDKYIKYQMLKKDRKLQKVDNFIVGIPYQKDINILRKLNVI